MKASTFAFQESAISRASSLMPSASSLFDVPLVLVMRGWSSLVRILVGARAQDPDRWSSPTL